MIGNNQEVSAEQILNWLLIGRKAVTDTVAKVTAECPENIRRHVAEQIVSNAWTDQRFANELPSRMQALAELGAVTVAFKNAVTGAPENIGNTK